jgi:SprT protein
MHRTALKRWTQRSSDHLREEFQIASSTVPSINALFRRTLARPFGPDIRDQSLANIRGHAPASALPALRRFLDGLPVLIHVTENRRSKHGDYRPSPCRRYGIVTVNAFGNPWQFLFTLLHELAHAETHIHHGARARPHGIQWKTIFSRLLLDFAGQDLFPESLTPFIRQHAMRPRYSSCADLKLAMALREYDTLDHRPMVAELPRGQRFSLDGVRVLTKRELSRTRYKCTTARGREYYVPASARVHTIYESSNL